MPEFHTLTLRISEGVFRRLSTELTVAQICVSEVGIRVEIAKKLVHAIEDKQDTVELILREEKENETKGATE